MERFSQKSALLAWVIIVVGAIALFGGFRADIPDFFAGVLQGVGFVAALGGSYLLGVIHEFGRSGREPAKWLPSRDGGR